MADTAPVLATRPSPLLPKLDSPVALRQLRGRGAASIEPPEDHPSRRRPKSRGRRPRTAAADAPLKKALKRGRPRTRGAGLRRKAASRPTSRASAREESLEPRRARGGVPN